MNKKLFNVLVFTAGAAIGSVVTWKVVKTKYERILQDEIDSFKETWPLYVRQESEKAKPAEGNATEVVDDEDEEFEDSVLTDYSKLARIYKPSTDTKDDNDGKGGGDEVPYINGPYVIAPEDYGDGEYDHALHCLTYYADGILSNDWYEVLDIDETIGEDSIKHFGEYAEDVVHVRNERLEADYEVVRDPRKYKDVIENDPLMRPHAN